MKTTIRLRRALRAAASALEALPVARDSVYWKYRQNQVNKARRAAAK